MIEIPPMSAADRARLNYWLTASHNELFTVEVSFQVGSARINYIATGSEDYPAWLVDREYERIVRCLIDRAFLYWAVNQQRLNEPGVSDRINDDEISNLRVDVSNWDTPSNSTEND